MKVISDKLREVFKYFINREFRRVADLAKSLNCLYVKADIIDKLYLDIHSGINTNIRHLCEYFLIAPKYSSVDIQKQLGVGYEDAETFVELADKITSILESPDFNGMFVKKVKGEIIGGCLQMDGAIVELEITCDMSSLDKVPTEQKSSKYYLYAFQCPYGKDFFVFKESLYEIFVSNTIDEEGLNRAIKQYSFSVDEEIVFDRDIFEYFFYYANDNLKVLYE